MNVVCVGDCGVDRYLPSGDVLPGGITSNFARQARRCFPVDDTIHVISATGNDGAASQLARGVLVGQAGIQCHIEEIAGNTPVQFIEIDSRGERNFVRYDEGVLGNFRVNRRQSKLIGAADLLVTPVFRQVHRMFESVLGARCAGRVAVDFADFAVHPDFEHLESHIERIDIAFFGLQENQREHIERIAEIASARRKLMIVTLGDAGSIAFNVDERYRCAALPVARVVDTTGAGDAFAAGFLASLMHDGSIPASLDKGAALAAETIQHSGAVPP